MRTSYRALFIGGPVDGEIVDCPQPAPKEAFEVDVPGHYDLMWIRENRTGGIRVSVTAHYLWRAPVGAELEAVPA
jgi:hypothetical protein